MQFHVEMTLELIEKWLSTEKTLSDDEKRKILEESKDKIEEYHKLCEKFVVYKNLAFPPLNLLYFIIQKWQEKANVGYDTNGLMRTSVHQLCHRCRVHVHTDRFNAGW